MVRFCKLAALLLVFGPLLAQENVDWETMSRIRLEAFNNSKVMETLHHLTDEIGPRLTGSPPSKRPMNTPAKPWRAGGSAMPTSKHGARSVADGAIVLHRYI